MLLETAFKIIKKFKKGKGPLVAKKPDEDFIPYVCHYNPNTILTKNGELLQIIRITGFKNESVASELISLRDTVRSAIKDNIEDNKFAFWFSTIRRKKSIVPKGKFTDFFSKTVNDFWVKDNDLENQFINELYVTVIVEGLNSSVVNFNSFMRSFSYGATKNLHQNFLQESSARLEKTVNKILADIEDHGAKLLGIKEWDGILYSEPMRFFGKITNLYEDRYPVSSNDISDDIASHKVAFGNRELEVVGDHNKNFAAMMSLKEYREVSVESLDRILQLPFEFIITQSFDFAFNKKDLDQYEYQNYILKVSGDEDFRQSSGIADFIEDRDNKPTDYGKIQTTIMFISGDQKSLEKDIKLAIEQFNSLGFIVVREDVFSEHCFWSQLPGNFRYLCRQKVINTNLIAGFASLHSFPTGLISGGHWRNAVSVFKTVINTPYFFNFHEEGEGHCLLFGEASENQNILLNFLIAQSQKFDVRTFYFDSDGSAKPFIKALSGNYFDIEGEVNTLKLNPLQLAANIENKDFLISFFYSFVLPYVDKVKQSEIDSISQIIDKICSSNITEFDKAVDLFNTAETKNIYKILQPHNFSNIFNSKSEIDLSKKTTAFGLKDIFEQKKITVPIIHYLLHQIEAMLGKTPTIIVLSDALDYLENPVMATRFKEFLIKAKEKNTVVIITCKDPEQIAKSALLKEVNDHLTNKFFMPNNEPNEVYKEVFGLRDEEIEIVSMMNPALGHFFLKRPSESVIAMANFSVEIKNTLCADEMTVSAMSEVISSNLEEGKTEVLPEVWMPQFFEVLTEIEKERIAEQKRLAREAAEKFRQKKIAAQNS
jgi:type IV secretion system protein VirB4